jgi:signal transduction histidine kinase/DNA-binding NarL/FixJ family response regulator
MSTNFAANNIIVRFGITDALYRSTAWAGNIVTGALVALVAGFGPSGILLSSFVQLLISALLEIPTGLVADKYGHKKAVILGFSLKVFVTLSFAVSFYFAVQKNTSAAYLFLALEAMLDAFANSFINGAYQAAFSRHYSQECAKRGIDTKNAPPLFLASFKYGMPLRVVIPLAFALGSWWLSFHAAMRIEYMGAILLFAVFMMRFVVIAKVFSDLKSLPSAKDDPHKTGNSLYRLAMSAKRELLANPSLTAMYVAGNLAQLATSMYFLARSFAILQASGIRESDVWLGGMFGAIALQFTIILVSRVVYPKLTIARAKKHIPLWILSTGILFAINALFSHFSQSEIILFAVNAIIAIAISVLAGGISRGATSLALEVIDHNISATWLSGASTIALLLFSLVSGVAVSFQMPSIENFYVCCGFGIILLFVAFHLYSSDAKDFRLTFKSFLVFLLSSITILFALAGTAFDTFSFVRNAESTAKKNEAGLAQSFENSVRQPLIQGSHTEVKSRVEMFLKNKALVCASVFAGTQEIGGCRQGRPEASKSNEISSNLWFDGDNKNSIGTYKLSFDRSWIQKETRERIAFAFVFFGAFSIAIFFAISKVAEIISDELQKVVRNSENEDEIEATNFAISEFEILGKKLTEVFQLKKKSQVESAIASTTSALAHDVRKPFSMLKMVLNSILNAKTPIEAQEIARGSLPEIAQSLVTVDGMIQDVMQIGSSSKPNQEIASPDTIIENALNEVFRIFPEATVTIEYDLQHGHCIFIDTLRVARVFSNIICNALQAMDEKGTLWIKTYEKENFLEFKLGNVGSCIPPANLPKLFEAFFTSDKKGGTGLGLAIAQKVVTEHGGSIRCESERNTKYPDGYVEFIFTLPLTSELCEVRTQPLPNTANEVHAQFASMKPKNAETASAEEIALEIELSKKIESMDSQLPSLLIVDDEAVYRNSLANLLHQGNLPFGQIPVLFAKNYEEALENCKAHNPFLVIQDIDLGANSKNGIVTIAELKRLAFKGRICVHSNRFLFGDQKEAFDAGADSVMPKPMSRIQLLKIILQALSELTGDHQTPESIKTEIPVEKIEPSRRIKLAFLDDTKTFTMIWKMNLKNSLNIETFSKTTAFLERAASEPDFLASFDVIVTDYHFADGDPHTGKTFAAEVRKMGFTKPVMLATNGDFSVEELKPHLNGCIGKEVPSLQEVESWLQG